MASAVHVRSNSIHTAAVVKWAATTHSDLLALAALSPIVLSLSLDDCRIKSCISKFVSESRKSSNSTSSVDRLLSAHFERKRSSKFVFWGKLSRRGDCLAS
eukprot:707074_1